jgi:NAD+ diphosphatase
MPFGQPASFAPAFAPPDPPPGEALWLLFRRSELLVRLESPEPLYGAGPSALGLSTARTQYLGILADRHCYTAEIAAEAQPPAGWSFRSLRTLFGSADDSLIALAGRALQLVEWDRTHAYCGACGSATLPRPTERSRECPACGLIAYPRLAPVVMCLVRRGEEMLLARSPRFAEGVYSALAGFVEPGETLEQCVEREVLEEVGVRVRNLRYFASQPWPFPHSLMIAFFADHAGGEIAVDGIEIEAANWFSAGNMPKLPAKISIARRLIDAAMGEMAAR